MPAAIISIPNQEALDHERLLALGPHLERRGPQYTIASYTAHFTGGQRAVIDLIAGEPPFVEGTLFVRDIAVARLEPTDGLLGTHSFAHGHDVFEVLVSASAAAPHQEH